MGCRIMADGALVLPPPFETTDVHIPIFPVIANGNWTPPVIKYKIARVQSLTVTSEMSWAPKYGHMYYSQGRDALFWFDGYQYVMLEGADWKTPLKEPIV